MPARLRPVMLVTLCTSFLLATVAASPAAAADVRHRFEDPAGDLERHGSYDGPAAGYDIQEVTVTLEGTTAVVTATLDAPWPGEGSVSITVAQGPGGEHVSFSSGPPSDSPTPDRSYGDSCLHRYYVDATLVFTVDLTACPELQVADVYVSVSTINNAPGGSEPSYIIDYAPYGQLSGPFDLRPGTAPELPPPAVRDISDTCPESSLDGHGYSDIGWNLHAVTIACVSSHGIAQGRSPGVFAPHGTLTSGQTATFLVRTLAASGHTLPTGANVCNGRGGLHEDAIEQLVTVAIMTSPDPCATTAMTRGEMSRWVHSALQYASVPRPDTPTDWYTDDDHHPAQKAINALSSYGIVSGKAPGEFSPDDTLTRAQMATFLARTLDLLTDA